MLITAAVFALASIPTFLFLRERATPQPLSAPATCRGAFTRLTHTLRQARRYRDLMHFLACTVCYQAGIAAVVTLAAIYAEQVMHFATRDTLLLIFAVNITAAIGAVAFGYVQDRIGHVATLALTLVGWIVMVGLAWAATGLALFWIAANIAGLCMGASQSAGRAIIGTLTPPTRLRNSSVCGAWQ